MKSSRKIWIALAVIAAVAAVLWFARPLWQKSGDTGTLTLYGNVDIRQVSLAFSVSERIKEMRAEEGQSVSAGQVLAVLDTESTRLQLDQAKAQTEIARQAALTLENGSRPEELRQAQAQFKAAQAESERSRLHYQRLQNLNSTSAGKAVSQLNIDNARAQFQAARAQADAYRQTVELLKNGARSEDRARAEAQLQAAQAQQNLLQYHLDQTELKAPQDGVIRARLLEAGDMASPQRAVYTLALTDPKWIRAYVNGIELGKIKPDMPAQIFIDSAPDTPVKGHIGYISSVAEFTPKSVQTEDLRTDLVYEVRIIAEDPGNHLRLGMPATVKIALDAQGG